MTPRSSPSARCAGRSTRGCAPPRTARTDLQSSLDLVLDPGSDAAVRAGWAALSEAGLPSQADHRGASNAPHATLLAAEEITSAVQQTAVDALGPLLPRAVAASGLVVLGGSRYALARLLVLDPELLAAVAAVRRAAGLQEVPWVPHVTIGRRMTADDVAAALQVVGGDAGRLVLGGLRRWDPATRTVTSLVEPDGPGEPGGPDQILTER